MYADGAAETYQLPLAVSLGVEGEEIAALKPLTVIATVTSTSGSMLLHDATSGADLRMGLLTLIERNASSPLSSPGGHTAAGADLRGRAAAAPSLAASVPVKMPAPLDAQPGDVASSPREGAPANVSGATFQPRESPTAGNCGPATGSNGCLQARASSAFSSVRLSQPMASRVGSAEQSNTSILYGKELILKLFRRLQPGENPDVEIGRFLTEVARFPRIAPFLGEIDVTPFDGEKTTVAMLQGLVANQGDGWQWFLDELSGFFTAVSGLPTPPEMPAPSFLGDREVLREIAEHAGPALASAGLLGKRTAEMHLALATPTDDPAFAAEPMTAEDLASDARRIDAQITSTLEALKMKLSTLKDLTADDAGLLLSRRINLFSRAHAITSSTPGGQRIRIHGDYHLGQTLRTPAGSGAGEESGDFVILDFEGEPARPLAERRQKQSPLKDVAGMLRSFSYVAYSGLQRYLAESLEATRTPDAGSLSAWTVLWQNAVSQEFLRAYRQSISSNTALLPTPQQAQSLLGAYLLEKALYELLYELNNRPEWLRIPLTGILAL
jgi:maltose alpha-D-glucosyltransferase/alpha-amylase